MQKFHLITSVLVAIFIYAVVIERDALIAFASEHGARSGAEPVQLEETIRVSDPAVSVVAMHSVAVEVQSGIILRGQTEAARRVEVRSEASGKVITEPLRHGQNVEKDQVLCQLDSGTLDAQLAEARARQLDAEASANTASQLAERGFGPENSAISARANLESARASVLRVEQALSQLTITAPFGGILETDTAEIGSLLQPGGLCATVIALDTIKLVGYVPELDVLQLEVGQLAGARLLSGREVVGQVSFISRSADPLTRTFRLEVEIPNPGLEIREGQTVEIGIALDGVRGHLLPQNVLTLDNDGNLGVRVAVEALGRIMPDGVARFIPVNIIRDAPEGFWLSGLPDEVDVIIVGQDYVIDGRDISVTMQEDMQ